MSTRIYGGKIVRLPIIEVHKRLLSLRAAIAQKGAEIIDREIAALTAKKFDQISLGKNEIPQNVHKASDLASIAFHEVRDRFKEIYKSGYRDPSIDTKFKIYLFPRGDDTLFMVDCEQEEMIKILTDEDWVEDYHYQNASDRPDSISEKDWRQREEDWDEVMPSGIPAHTCLLFQMFDGEPYMHTKVDRVWNLIPAVEARVRRWAEDNYIMKNYDSDRGVSQVFELLETYRESATLQSKYQEAIRPFIVNIEPETPVRTVI